MHGSFEKSGETVKNIYRSWGVGVFVLPGLLLAVLIGMLVTQPNVSTLISQAAQAEFAATSGPELAAPEVAPAAKDVQAVNAN